MSGYSGDPWGHKSLHAGYTDEPHITRPDDVYQWAVFNSGAVWDYDRLRAQGWPMPEAMAEAERLRAARARAAELDRPRREAEERRKNEAQRAQRKAHRRQRWLRRLFG